MDAFESMIGRSPNFESLVRSARMVATTDVTVLVSGETGTGKELLAHGLYEYSPRANKPFVALNCAALPEAIAESELFGHRKGSFTGATSDHKGVLQSADHGTLFLDEVDSLSLPVQAKLLRFLECGECQQVGETKTVKVDVRIIAASNSDLLKKIDAGEFRRDLYYRLNVVPLSIPPLRERNTDIARLVNHFITKFADNHAIKAPKVGRTALKAFNGYDWPGNIRELRNICERLTILLAGSTIEVDNLPPEFRTAGQPRQMRPSSIVSLPENGIDLETVEIDLINQALTRTQGNRSKSARLLGISRDTLLYRINKYGIAS